MPILKNALLRDFAYYGTGGPCDRLYQPQSAEEAAEYFRQIRRDNLPLVIIGAGTNSLVMDEAFPGAVMVLSGLNAIEVHGDIVNAGAGVDNSTVAKTALAYELSGAGWMYRLPGQLGGTIRMNARCYGGEISQIVRKVTVVDQQGALTVREGQGVFRGYKDTVFMANGDLIVQAELKLTKGRAADIAQLMAHCEKDRQRQGQFDFPSCGCVFKNDYSVGIPSGRLLDAAGAKALRHGGAEVSQHHANFVFNKGASSRDILELTLMMRDLVHAEFGVWLEYEMEVLGLIPRDLEEALHQKKPHQPNLEKITALTKVKPVQK